MGTGWAVSTSAYSMSCMIMIMIISGDDDHDHACLDSWFDFSASLRIGASLAGLASAFVSPPGRQPKTVRRGESAGEGPILFPQGKRAGCGSLLPALVCVP